MNLDTCFKSLKMRFNPRIVSSVAAIALTCVVSAAAYYYRSRKRVINEVMIVCKLQYNVFNYFDKLLSYIEAAESTIHVCMPSVHNPAIQGRLVEAIQRKGIRARIIIDAKGYNESTAIFLEELTEAGAEIRMGVGEDKMHHKFCLIDDEILMTGTLDWGNDLSFDDWNYVYITSKDQLVQPIKKEFDQMWNDERNKLLQPWEETTENDDCIENVEGTIVIKEKAENNNEDEKTIDSEVKKKYNLESIVDIETNKIISITEVEEFVKAEINFNNNERLSDLNLQSKDIRLFK